MSFTEVKTVNIDLETINGEAYVPGGAPSVGAQYRVNTSDGAGAWENSTYSIEGYMISTIDNSFELSDALGNAVFSGNTQGVGLSSASGYNLTLTGGAIGVGAGPFFDNINYSLPTTAPSGTYQILAVVPGGPPAVVNWTDPLQTVYSQASLITDSTNASINTQYLISNFNGSAVPLTATDQPIQCFQILNGKDYTIKIILYSSSAPLGAGSSVQIGLATGQVSDGGAGTLTYTLSNIAASTLTVPTGTFSSASGYSTSATFTYTGTTHAICCPYILLTTGSSWNSTKTVSFSINVTQNN